MKTVKERALERASARKNSLQKMAPTVGVAPSVQTEMRTMAPGLTKGPISIPGGTVNSVYDRTPRLPCPNCGELISISLYDLVSASEFSCPHCLTKMTMDRPASKDALGHLQNFYVAAKNSELL